MKDTAKIYFNVVRLISLIFGILFCITIIGAVLGIPMLIASNKFKEALNMSDYELVKNRSSLLGWGIFLAVVFSPSVFGLIILLVLTMMVDNYIGNIEEGNYAQNEKSFSQTVEENVSNAWSEVKNTFRSETDIDKQKKELKKLDRMKEEGLITEEEYSALRKKILGL